MDRSELKNQVFMDIAIRLGELTTCDRAAIGAVIVKEGRCISWGFNGAPPGLPHCSENMHGWESQASDEVMIQEGTGFLNTDSHLIASRADELIEANGCRNATHAEANALAFAARQGIATDGGTLYVTMSPCDTCARLLIAAGIVRVYFKTMYRDDSGIVTLSKAGIECIEVP